MEVVMVPANIRPCRTVMHNPLGYPQSDAVSVMKPRNAVHLGTALSAPSGYLNFVAFISRHAALPLYGPRLPGFFALASISASMSSIDHSLSVTPAAIAGDSL
jgi:hypothetical protein